MRDHIWLFSKGGKLLYPKQPVSGLTAAGLPAPYGQINFCDLFAPLIPDANAHLGLPTSKTDHEGRKITVRNGYGINCDATTGGVKPPCWRMAPPYSKNCWNSDKPFYQGYGPGEQDGEIYDARVLWDEYHHRFWIAALFKNSNTVAFGDPATEDPMMLRPSTRSANVRSARRALLAIAESKTEDPRDGWNLYWVWGLPGQKGCPSSKGCVGFGTDYLSMGITSKYLTMESLGSLIPNMGDRNQVITIVPTSNPVSGPDAHIFQPAQSTLGQSLIQPAVQHKPDFDNGKEALFATAVYNLDDGAAGNQINISWVAPQSSPYESTPKFFSQPVTVSTFHAVTSEQPVKGGGTISDAKNLVNKLVYRDKNLYLTMGECVHWNSKGCLQSAVRLIRIRLAGTVRVLGTLVKLKLSVADDETITGNGSPPNGNWFAFPSVEVNSRHDIVLAYNSTSTKTVPDVRYSVFMHGEDQIRSSRLLQPGLAAVDGRHDYLGMSVDPFDQHGVWMIDGYGDSSGGWAYAFGKVLGKKVPDLEPVQAYVTKTGTTSKPYQLTLVVNNLGDGAAPATTARMKLTKRAATTIPIKSFSLPKIPAGGLSAPMQVSFSEPAAAVGHGYTLEIALDSNHQVYEYDEGNNTIAIAAP